MVKQNCKKTRSLINSDDTVNNILNHVLHQDQQGQNKIHNHRRRRRGDEVYWSVKLKIKKSVDWMNDQ
jgi:hypothetical protein